MKTVKKLLCLVLALVLVLGMTVTASAAEASAVEDGGAAAAGSNGETPGPEAPDPEEPTVILVRLNGDGALGAGYTTEEISENNEEAAAYMSALEQVQNDMAAAVDRDLFGGEGAFAPEANYTVITDAFDATVRYGDVERIAAYLRENFPEDFVELYIVPEVQAIDPIVDVESTTHTVSASATEMVGANEAWEGGYTGAGQLIAVIDTGIDIEHPSFDAGALKYSLEQLKEETGKDYTDKLLTQEKLAEKIPQLKAYTEISNQPNQRDFAKGAYQNEKFPFVFNYPQAGNDKNRFDVSVDPVTASSASPEHGMHVAGIAAANRYVPVEGEGETPTYMKYTEMEHPVVGVAPDAQIVFMKVFSGASAVESTYFRAIEDAIMLGCDSINLSLCNDNTGRSFFLNTSSNGLVDGSVFDKMVDSGALVACGAGNNGYFPYNNYANAYGLNYAEDIPMATGGSPGSLTNALTVAAAVNTTITGKGASFEEYATVMIDSDTVGIPAWIELDTSEGGTGTDYEYVFLGDPYDENDHKKYGDEDAYEDYPEDYFKGKIIFASRGAAVKFPTKHEWAAQHGAVGLVIYNNVRIDLIPDLDASSEKIPCALMSLRDKDEVLKRSTKNADGLYTGTMRVVKDLVTTSVNIQGGEMCDFSSWGTTGNLAIKPEITAPGGNIYSTVPGGYESMSGTSMATPSIAGQAAVVAQRLEEEDLLERDKNAFETQRALVTSLLMSTAQPLTDPESEYNLFYPVRQQGAGLANVGAATSSLAYIVMDKEATDSWADGKVKAELGDDAERKGIYSFSFTIRNLSDDIPLTYALGSTVMTPEIFEDEDGKYMSPQDIRLTSNVTFRVNGSNATAVTVPAGGSIKVAVTIELSQKDKAYFAENNPKGAFVEGYISMTGTTKDTVNLSVPFLAYYGNFSEPSMFDRITANEFDEETNRSYTRPDGKVNYIDAKNSYEYPSTEFTIGDNRFADESGFIPERNMSITNTTDILRIHPTFIRVPAIVHTVLSAKKPGEDTFTQCWDRYTWGNAAYSSYSGGTYSNEFDSISIQGTSSYFDQWELPVGTSPSEKLDPSRNITLWYGYDKSTWQKYPEGTEFKIEVIAPPELYTERTTSWAHGGFNILEDKLADGAIWTTIITLDNTKPTIEDGLMYGWDDVGQTGYLAVPVQDNRYVAAVLLLTIGTVSNTTDLMMADRESGKEQNYVMARVAADMEKEELGQTKTVEVPLKEELEAGKKKYYLVAVDYAGNFVTKEVTCPDMSKAIKINYTNETLTGFDSTHTYTINGETVEVTEDGTLPIDPDWMGTDLTIVDSSVEETYPQLLPVPARPEAPSLTTGTTSSASSANGSIRGLDAEKTYEYRAADAEDETWMPVERGAETIPGLSAGKYLVRLAATESSSKSAEAEVEVRVYVAPSIPAAEVTTGDKTEDGETTTETTATPDASVKDGEASVTVTESTGREIVKQAEANDSDTVVVAPKISGDVTKAEVTVPGKTVEDLAEKTDADLKVETPVGSVTLPDEALADLGKAGDVTVSVEKTEDTVSVRVSAGGETVDEIPGGVKAAFELKDGEVAVVVSEDGTEAVVPKSFVEDGTAYVLLDGTATVKIVNNSKSFEDVDAGDWFEDAVDFASSHELFNGISETTFEPGTDMSRAMLATVLWRLESEAASDGKITFPDVAEDTWYTESVAWAAETGVIAGTDRSTFEPDRGATRQEMALMLYRYAKNVGIDTTGTDDLVAFTDAADVGDWAVDAMSWAVSVGLLQGDGSGHLDPTGTASRAQVATVLQRLVALMVK